MSIQNPKLQPRLKKATRTGVEYTYSPATPLTEIDGLKEGDRVTVIGKSRGKKNKIIEVQNTEGKKFSVFMEDLVRV